MKSSQIRNGKSNTKMRDGMMIMILWNYLFFYHHHYVQHMYVSTNVVIFQ